MAATRERARPELFRMTPRRRAVLDAVARFGGHPTASEIYAKVRQSLPGIAYATVYNALHALVSLGALGQLNFGDAASRYDCRTDSHDHAVCEGCGMLVDVTPSRPARAARRAAAETGFSVREQHTQFFGVCPSCAANPSRAGKND